MFTIFKNIYKNTPHEKKKKKENSNRNHSSCSLRHTTRAYLKEKTQQKNANGSRHVNE